MFFEVANLEPDFTHVSRVDGQRRSLIEQYYKNIDFSSPEEAKKLIVAYEYVIDFLVRHQANVVNPEEFQETIDELISCMASDGCEFKNGKFFLAASMKSAVLSSSMLKLEEASVNEHIKKANQKIEQGDYAGAITNCYTLVECMLKKLLQEMGVDFKQHEGDIRELYKLLSPSMNLNPHGENVESYLKQILGGLKSLISGLFSLSNKGSDRHHRKFTPLAHHSKLAVNATLSLCEFLLDSYNFQKRRAKTKKML